MFNNGMTYRLSNLKIAGILIDEFSENVVQIDHLCFPFRSVCSGCRLLNISHHLWGWHPYPILVQNMLATRPKTWHTFRHIKYIHFSNTANQEWLEVVTEEYLTHSVEASINTFLAFWLAHWVSVTSQYTCGRPYLENERGTKESLGYLFGRQYVESNVRKKRLKQARFVDKLFLAEHCRNNRQRSSLKV